MKEVRKEASGRRSRKQFQAICKGERMVPSKGDLWMAEGAEARRANVMGRHIMEDVRAERKAGVRPWIEGGIE